MQIGFVVSRRLEEEEEEEEEEANGGKNARIAGYLLPDVPTIDNFPTFPRRRRSNIVNPTTPTFLSDPEAPVPTKPVVYSPVPTMRTFNGLATCCGETAGAG